MNFKSLLLILILICEVTACQKKMERIYPSKPEWQPIGSIHIHRMFKMRDALQKHQFIVAFKHGELISEVWVKAEYRHRYKAALKDWKQSPETGIWFDP
jgi:hypothetical protein